MINEKLAREYCCEDISLIRGYERAVNDTTQVYDLHHLEGVFYTKDEMKRLGKYYKQPAMALIFLTRSEHFKIHHAFNNQWAEKVAESTSKPVYQYTLEGVFVKKWQSAMEVEYELGFSKVAIRHCCRGESNSSNGYVWSYVEIDCMKPMFPPKNSKREICQYNLDGEFVKKWPSLSHIFHSLNYNRSYICSSCNGKRKQAYGYIWRYAE